MVVRVTVSFLVLSCMAICASDGLHQPRSDVHMPSVRTLNAIMLFEKGATENAYAGPGSLTSSLYEAIKSQSAPIFVSGALLHTLYVYARDYREKKQDQQVIEKIQDLREQLRRLAELRGRMQGIVQVVADLEKRGTLDAMKKRNEKLDEFHALFDQIVDLHTKVISEWKLIMQYCSYHVLDFNQWDVYKCPNTDAYVLVPHAYEEKIAQTWSKIAPQKREKIESVKQEHDITERELRLGLRVDHAHVMRKIDTKEQLFNLVDRTWGTMAAKQLSRSWILASALTRKINLYTPFTSCFVTHQERNAIFGKWNIYIDGHGYPPLKRTSGRDKLLSGVVKPLIAGMSYDTFQDLLTFLHSDVQTNFLYWTTCYGGGKNLDVAKNMLLHLEGEQHIQNAANDFLEDISPRDFVAASGSVTDASVTPSISDEAFLRACLESVSLTPFQEFFDALDTYARIKVENKERLIQRGVIGPRQYSQFVNSLLWPYIKAALWAITPVQEGELERDWIYSAPMVYVPGQDGFEIADINDGYLSLDRAYLLRNYGKDIVVDNKEALLLHEPVVTNPLVIQSSLLRRSPWFMSLIPGNAMHTLERVELTSVIPLEQFLYDSFFSMELAYDTVFHIKKLTGRGLIPPQIQEFLEDTAIPTDRIEDLMVYVARAQMLKPTAHRKHRYLFTVRDSQGNPRYVEHIEKKGGVDQIELDEKEMKKEKEALIRKVTHKQ